MSLIIVFDVNDNIMDKRLYCVLFWCWHIVWKKYFKTVKVDILCTLILALHKNKKLTKMLQTKAIICYQQSIQGDILNILLKRKNMQIKINMQMKGTRRDVTINFFDR